MNRRSTTVRLCRAAFGAGASFLCSACDDPLIDPALVSGPRVIGARVHADRDSAVAEPAAGESATLDWLLVSNRPQPFSATIAWCVGAPTLLGAPRCAGPAFDERRVTGAFDEPVSLEFTLPTDVSAGDAWLAWLGHCDAGEATFDATGSAFRCPDGADALSAFYRGFIPADAPNQNPSLSDDVLLLGGEPWLSMEGAQLVGSSCVDTALPRLLAGAPSLLELELGGDDREALEQAPGSYAAHDRESLVYTHVSSRVGLDRAFSAIDYDSDEPRFTLPVSFGADAAPGAEGETVSFYLVVRDERGGVDWLRRDACLVPQ
jgi:hypothetical protein